MVAKSLRALLANVIDYAGLFPPASLSLDEAIRNYARYRTEPEAWMLGRFICPAARLAELSPYVEELFSSGPPLDISALGGGKNDFQDMSTFRSTHTGRATVDVYETKIPPEILQHFSLECESQPLEEFAKQAVIWSKQTSLQLEHSRNENVIAFFEPVLGDRPENAIVGASCIVDLLNPRFGLKLRCGGLVASAFPTSKIIAMTLHHCRGIVPLKFTAGLHHPLRQYHSSVKCKMHGFVNVFAAGALPFRSHHVEELLNDESPSSFSFTDELMKWRDLEIDISEIEAARRDRVISFGSCSFDEPRDDLRALGWL